MMAGKHRGTRQYVSISLFSSLIETADLEFVLGVLHCTGRKFGLDEWARTALSGNVEEANDLLMAATSYKVSRRSRVYV